MWTYKHSVTVNATPAIIWPFYAEVGNWPRWDDAMERVDLEGPFTQGTSGVMHIQGFGPVPFTLTIVEAERRFADLSELGEINLAFEHTLEPSDDGSRTTITHAVTISGPAADHVGPQMGPGISEAIPGSMASIALLAEAASVVEAR
jgi:ligand-binding SRPBCC domain-containing protein